MSHDRQGTRTAEGARPGLLLRFRGLKVQIVLWTILHLTLVLIGVAFTGVYSHERAMRDLVQERDQALAEVQAGQVAELLGMWIAALQGLAAQESFLHRDRAAQQRLLTETGNLDGLFIGSVTLLEKAGDRIAGGENALARMGDMEQVTVLMQVAMSRQDAAI